MSDRRSRCGRHFQHAALCILGLGAAACSSVYPLEVRTDPPGAFVFVNGEPRGVSNTAVTLDFGASPVIFVQILLTGYRPVLQPLVPNELPPGGQKTFTLQPLN